MRTQQFRWLSMIIFYFLCLCNRIFAVSGLYLEDQQSLLIQLKKELKFDYEKSEKLVSWDQSISCCQWSGVTCDKYGHVTELDLSEESICDGFDNSSSLFRLQNLQVLNLAFNNLSGIPYGFNKLKNLTYLNLSYATFYKVIPMPMDISDGYHLLDYQLDLQKLAQNLTRIRYLYVDGLFISTQGKEWSKALLLMPNLQELSMSACNLSGPLDSSLTRLKNLSLIRLSNNNLSSLVPETFANFPNLTILDLSNCGLTGMFPEKIFNVATLSDIDLSINQDLHGSFPDFQFNTHLRTLIVSNTLFSGALPASISNLSRLSTLDLSYCQFNRTLPTSMSKLTELTDLYLSSNNFTGTIPPLNTSKNLFHLDLSHNNLTGSIASIHLEGLTKLVHIDFQDNVLSGSIPLSLFTLPLINTIQLSNNNFQGQHDEPSNISSSLLETLDLSYNKLEGLFPVSIFQLRSLSILKLSSNKFNGTIHLDMFQRHENLITLDLSYNHLSVNTNVSEVHASSFPKMRSLMLASCNLTEFPWFLRKQSGLIMLDLSSNYIQGSIPSWISELSSLIELNLSNNLLTKLEEPVHTLSALDSYFPETLDILDLHSNHLQGKLPVYLFTLSYMDCSSNNFSSTIPSNFGTYLTLTSYLSLAKNNLHGSIPNSLCNATSLKVLDLSYNNFKGTIPECLAKSETLSVLSFRNNILTGTIPDTFSESCALRILDLHDNQLGGLIPNSLVYCTALEVIDLGKNHINDEFPCWLKKLSTLRVIILRENKFHGPIGCPKTNGSWHKLQIVDLAFNNFCGLLPGKCFKTWDAMIFDEGHGVSKFDYIHYEIFDYRPFYYQDSITLTSKGLQMKFEKILSIFNFIDLSSNNLEGPIPEELMNLTGLLVLNLSHNAFIGHIPSSIGNLKQLESLDLSSNHFNGTIPTQLAIINFLSYLNLSFNQLEGKIPIGTQIQTFNASSFEGNDGLYGPPLTESPHNIVPPVSPHGRMHAIEWKPLTVEFGLIFGLGLVFGPLLFWKQWRQWYWKRVDRILCCIFPQLHVEYISQGGQMYQVLRWGY